MKTPPIHGTPPTPSKVRVQTLGPDVAREKIRAHSAQTATKPVHGKKSVEAQRKENRLDKFLRSEDQDIYLHDSVRFKKDVPGTEFKAGMIGGVVEACGIPARSVEVEIDRVPMYIEHVSVEYLEKID